MQARAEAQDPPPALPVFEPWRTAEGKLVGRISLTAFTQAGFTIVEAILGGVTVRVEDLEAGVAAIPERNAVLVLRIKKGSGKSCEYRFQLAGGMPSNNPLIWRCDPDDPPERVDAWLTALLGDVRAAGSPTRPTGAPGKAATTETDDAYRVPLQRRLSLIARHRNELRNAVSADTLRSAINDLLKDPNERKVAEMLLFETTDGKSPLLEAARDVASGRK